MNTRILLASFLAAIAATAEPTIPGPPQLSVTMATTDAADGRLLTAKDNQSVTLRSVNFQSGQTMAFTLTLPMSTVANPGELALVLAIKGDRPLPIRAVIKLPKTKAGVPLSVDYLPTDAIGVVRLVIPSHLHKQLLDQPTVTFDFHIDDLTPNAPAITVNLDAAIIYATAKVEASKAAIAFKAAETEQSNEPSMRVHEFVGGGSTTSDRKRDAVKGDWDKSFNLKSTKPITGANKKTK